MTNKDFYGDNLQIVVDGKYGSIYNRLDTEMDLLTCVFGEADNVYELIDK